MATKDKDEDGGNAAPKKKSKLILLIGLVLALVVGGGGGYYFLKPSAAKTKSTATRTKKSAKGAKSDPDVDADDSDSDTPDEDSDESAKDSKAKTRLDAKSKKTDPTEDSDVGEGPDRPDKPKGAPGKPNALLPTKDKDVKKIVDIPPFILNLADTDDNRFLRLTMSLGMTEEGEEKPNELFLTRVRNAVLAVLTTKSSTDVLSPEGKALLRKELLSAVRTATDDQHIVAIYITELIVQR